MKTNPCLPRRTGSLLRASACTYVHTASWRVFTPHAIWWGRDHVLQAVCNMRGIHKEDKEDVQSTANST